MYEEYIAQAEEKLNASKLLFEKGFYGDAVSRAYYCMYFAATALLSLKNISVKTHKGVLSNLDWNMLEKD